MSAIHAYPVFLALAGRQCLVIGLGKVGLRKISGLLAANAGAIIGIDTRPLAELDWEIQSLVEKGRLAYRQGGWTEADIKGSFLVFACCGNVEENRKIAKTCAELQILCDCATEPANGSFILPSVARSGNLCAALSTGGQSPYLAKKWKKELGQWLAPRQKLGWLMGRLRPVILGLNLPQAQNAALFEQIANSPLEQWLNDADNIDKCHEWLKTRLPASVDVALAKIFLEYADAFA